MLDCHRRHGLVPFPADLDGILVANRALEKGVQRFGRPKLCERLNGLARDVIIVIIQALFFQLILEKLQILFGNAPKQFVRILVKKLNHTRDYSSPEVKMCKRAGLHPCCVRALNCTWLVLAVALFQSNFAQAFTCKSWDSAALKAQAPAPGAWTLGAKRLLYYRVRFTDTTETEPISVEQAEEILGHVNDTFRHMSFGKFSLNWVISPLLQLDHDAAYYTDAGFTGLLFDVRNAAEQAGFHYADFDLDLIRCPQIPGLPQGQANIHLMGAVVHADLVNVYVHELGHNLGLFHANSWENSRPQLQPRSAPPFPSNVAEYSDPFIFDSAGVLGDDDLRSPGRSVEYGDVFDTMGGGAGDYNAAFKARIGWLSKGQVQTTGTNGVYRLYAYDQATTQSNRMYALRIDRLIEGRGGNFSFRYWACFRAEVTDEALTPVGLELRWVDQAESYTSQLLDMLPGTSALFWDAPLPLGRTFTDGEAGLRVRPIGSGVTDSAKWMDVQVQFGLDPGNHAPSLSLAASALQVEPGESVEFIAASSDADGDEVSLFWNFGDATYDNANGRVTKVWKKPGKYLVSCEASDGAGGLIARQILVSVGKPLTFSIRGRVLADDGTPLAGAVVNNGKTDPETGTMLPDFMAVRTDSDGVFILANLGPGDYEIGAAVYGWNVTRTDGQGTVRIESGDLSGIEFTGSPLPVVSVQVSEPVIGEGAQTTIVFTRTGSTKEALPLEFLLNGNAASGGDFRALSNQSIIIPAGAASVSVPFEALEDLDEEPPEQVIVTAIPASEMHRFNSGRSGTNDITYYYSGWEPRDSERGPVWFATRPSFRREPGATASLTILDSTPRGLQRVSVIADNSTAFERTQTTIVLHVQRIGSTDSPLTVSYTLGGSALNGFDYDLLPLTVTIPAGSDSAEVIISPLLDDALEGAETVEFALAPSPSYMIEEPASASLAIQEDEFNSSPSSVAFGKRFDAVIVVRMTGEHGQTYILETSEDLKRWDSVSTNQIEFSPVGIRIPDFFDAQRFYRSRHAAP
jgi:hypothetical protein